MMSEANYLMKHIWLHVILCMNTYTFITVMLCLEGEGAEHYDYKRISDVLCYGE